MGKWLLSCVSALFTIAGVVTFFASGGRLSALGPALFFAFSTAVGIRGIVEERRRRAALSAERVIPGGGVPIRPSRSRLAYLAGTSASSPSSA